MFSLLSQPGEISGECLGEFEADQWKPETQSRVLTYSRILTDFAEEKDDNEASMYTLISFMKLQGSKLRLTGRQCDQKLSAGD